MRIMRESIAPGAGLHFQALAFAANGDLQAAQFGAAQRGDHVLGTIPRDLDEREGIVDLDGANGARFETRLAGDRADEVAGADAAAAARADEQANHVFVAGTPAV